VTDLAALAGVITAAAGAAGVLGTTVITVVTALRQRPPAAPPPAPNPGPPFEPKPRHASPTEPVWPARTPPADPDQLAARIAAALRAGDTAAIADLLAAREPRNPP
jgi:hypothetical protein